MARQTLLVFACVVIPPRYSTIFSIYKCIISSIKYFILCMLPWEMCLGSGQLGLGQANGTDTGG